MQISIKTHEINFRRSKCGRNSLAYTEIQDRPRSGGKNETACKTKHEKLLHLHYI